MPFPKKLEELPEGALDSKSSGFVEYWSGFYPEYAGSNEHLYNDHLYPNGRENKKFKKDDIEALYCWFYVEPLQTWHRDNVLNNRFLPNIQLINQLKDEFNFNNSEDDILQQINNAFSDDDLACWTIYLLHIIAPQNFPMFNQHVCRAYIFLTNQTNHTSNAIPSYYINGTNIFTYYDPYKRFFEEFSTRTKISTHNELKRLDEALWVFGKFLKSPSGRELVS